MRTWLTLQQESYQEQPGKLGEGSACSVDSLLFGLFDTKGAMRNTDHWQQRMECVSCSSSTVRWDLTRYHLGIREGQVVLKGEREVEAAIAGALPWRDRLHERVDIVLI